MRKAHLTAFLLLLTTAAFAQKSAVTSAFFHQRNGDLDKAKEAIDKAVVHEDTKAKPDAWYYRGTIYVDIYNSKKPEMKALSANPLQEAFTSFKKTQEVDKKDGEYYKNATKDLDVLFQNAFNEGVVRYQANNFTGAIESYELASKVRPEDTATILYMAYAAEQIKTKEGYDRVKQCYADLFKLNRRTVAMYRTLASYERIDNKMESALAILEEGRKYFPTDKDLARDELVILSSMNKLDQAIGKIEAAILLDPNGKDSENLYLTLGSIYDKQASDTKRPAADRTVLRQKSISNFQKTLEINPNNADANFNIGVFYFNEGVVVTKKLNDMTLNDYNKFGKKVEAQAKELYAKALPYFEKCYAVSPDDKAFRQSLKRTYQGLGRKADADKIKE